MDRRFPVRPDGGFRHDDLEWLHGLYTLLIVVALLVGAILLLRLLLQRPRPPRDWPRHPAIDELDLRYARGELERADYLQRRADLLIPNPLPDINLLRQRPRSSLRTRTTRRREAPSSAR